jgi:hypothetical protein
MLTFVGGISVGIAAGPHRDPQRYVLALAVSNILLGTVGFTIAACLAPAVRWRHLVLVALGVWLTSLLNVVFFSTTVVQWLLGGVLTTIMMAVGGAISYLFRRDRADGL